jgi:hypothetical protein
MTIENVATIAFVDNASGQHAAAIIRASKGRLSLCISLESDGDVEVNLGAQHAAEFLAAVQKALSIVQQAP